MLIVLWILYHPDPNSDMRPESSGLAPKETSMEYDPVIGKKGKTSRASIARTAEKDVMAAVVALQSLEHSKLRFIEEYEDDHSYSYIFVLDRFSREEQKQINAIAASVKGVGNHWFDGHLVSWSQKIRSEYLLPDVYEHYVVTIKSSKDSPDGSYSIRGIEQGELTTDIAGRPSSKDGKYHVIRSGCPFKWGEHWRFSHILGR